MPYLSSSECLQSFIIRLSIEFQMRNGTAKALSLKGPFAWSMQSAHSSTDFDQRRTREFWSISKFWFDHQYSVEEYSAGLFQKTGADAYKSTSVFSASSPETVSTSFNWTTGANSAEQSSSSAFSSPSPTSKHNETISKQTYLQRLKKKPPSFQADWILKPVTSIYTMLLCSPYSMVIKVSNFDFDAIEIYSRSGKIASKKRINQAPFNWKQKCVSGRELTKKKASTILPGTLNFWESRTTPAIL